MNLDRMHISALRHLLVELILQAKLQQETAKLDQIVQDTLPKLHSAMRRGKQLLTEKDVAGLNPGFSTSVSSAT